MEWIMKNSDTAKNHPGEITILAWLHTHVSGNTCNILSSIDVHTHKGLESTFAQIVTIVVEITKKGQKKHQAYDLTQMGRTRAGRCRQQGFHNECARKDFYHKIDCHFIFKEPLKVHTLTHTMDHGELLVTKISEPNRSFEAESVMESESDDMEMDIDKEVLTKQKTKCKACSKSYKNILQHLNHPTNEKCNMLYTLTEMNELKKESKKNLQESRKERDKRNKLDLQEARQKREQQQKGPLQEARKKRIKENPDVYVVGRKKRKSERKKALKNDDQQLFDNFMAKQSLGTLSYICVSCHRLLFKSGVAPYEIDGPKSEDLQDAIKNAKLEYCVSTDSRFRSNDGRLWICYSCKGNLLKGKMPNMCHANGLAVDEMPDKLKDLTYLELLMIKKNLVFIKVRTLKNSGMKEMNGKITNVPIQDEDILKTAGVLPRMEDELGTVNVAFKRKRKGPYYKKAELIRPQKINEALLYLIKKHPSYKNFNVDYLKYPKKYKFVNLPLIGYFEEDQSNLKTLDDAYSFLEKSKLLAEILSPLLVKNEANYENFMNQLVVNKSPRGQDSFIHSLFDQMR